MRDLVVVKCPVCGTNYLPSEIFMPDSFFGKQRDITRNASGEIEFYLGDDPDYEEEFVCESCLTKLKIRANLNFNVEVNNGEDFDEDYSTPINKPKKIKLDETELF
mgnify:CR=1 FL=1